MAYWLNIDIGLQLVILKLSSDFSTGVTVLGLNKLGQMPSFNDFRKTSHNGNDIE